jgi:glycosyltransferase involved in cell wall biosynthesis
MDYFAIKGKGPKGYFTNISRLKKHVKSTNPDLIHTHYSLSGWVSVLARTGKPMVLSLMGSDTYGDVVGQGKTTAASPIKKWQAKLIQNFYPAIIVKSENLKRSVWKEKACYVIPNGVNYHKFKPLDKAKCRKELDLPLDEKLILFMGDTGNVRKNYALLEKAYPLLKTKNTRVVTPYPVQHDQVPLYFNACDVLAFPSFEEGSPNIIKEALACNTSIVATASGDILERVQGLERVSISDFDEQEYAEKLDLMLSTQISEDTREIIRPQIDEDLIAGQIIDIYKKLINNGK